MGCNASHHNHHQKKDGQHVWDVTTDAPSQNGRVVIVTGANSGVGEVTVEYMLAKGATVVMACRNLKRAKSAKKEILDRLAKHEEKMKKTHKSSGDTDTHSEDSDHHERVATAGEPAAAPPLSYAQAVRGGLTATPPAAERLFIEELDLNSFNSIRSFARRVESRVAPFNLGQVDTLILNAGVMNIRKLEKSEDGFERQWQTNFLGHFLLVGELMPSLRRSLNQPVVVPVSALEAQKSHLAADSAFDFRFEKEWKGKYSGETVYEDTKLAAILFATELRNRHGDWLRVIPCHPGVCNTRLFRHSIKTIMKPTYEPASQGAEVEMRAATDTTLQNGTYIGTGGNASGEPVEEAPGALAVEPTTARALWEAAERAVGITY